MTEKELLEKKERIEQAKLKVSELEGKQGYLTTEMKETWKCKNLEEAKEVSSKLTVEAENLRKEIKKEENKLRGGNGWT